MGRGECTYVSAGKGAHCSTRNGWRVVVGGGRSLFRVKFQSDRASHSRGQAEAADIVGAGGAGAVNGGQVSGWNIPI